MAANRDKAKREHDRQQVSELLLQGMPQNAIAKKLGVNPSTICRDVKSITQEWVEHRLESAETHRELECQRLDFILQKLWHKIELGDVKSIGLALQVSALRIKLLGLEMPIQVKVDAIVQKEIHTVLNTISNVLSPEKYEEVLRAIIALENCQNTAHLN